ncbi:MAG: glycine cleavage system aminomethyltransferase GcvT [Deltaproteobacteria bacterium]|nr:glycine cleavage system aminomethyltransferase GcvT [Deltaproteobacteria bacterium]
MEDRRTPFTSLHEAAGARMVSYAGFSMPIQYSGLQEEHLRVRSAVGIFDVSHMGEIRVSGPKALEAVQHLVTNDAGRLEVGHALYACICNERGGVVDDTIVYRTGASEFMLCVNAANRAKDWAWLTSHNPHPDQATMVDEGDDWAQIAIQGPRAAELVSALGGAHLADLGTYHFALDQVFAGVAGAMVARTGYTGEDGFEVYLPAQLAEPVWTALLDAGAPLGVLPIGLGARDTLRLEARFCLYGHELGDEISPLQAGLNWTIGWKKGDFMGRDALLARRGKEPHRLAGLIMQDRRIPREGMKVMAGGEEVGWITSGTHSPSMERGVAMAYLRPDLLTEGTEVQVDVRGRLAPAQVFKGPFINR